MLMITAKQISRADVARADVAEVLNTFAVVGEALVWYGKLKVVRRPKGFWGLQMFLHPEIRACQSHSADTLRDPLLLQMTDCILRR